LLTCPLAHLSSQAIASQNDLDDSMSITELGLVQGGGTTFLVPTNAALQAGDASAASFGASTDPTSEDYWLWSAIQFHSE
jgi:hypothetical protein